MDELGLCFFSKIGAGRVLGVVRDYVEVGLGFEFLTMRVPSSVLSLVLRD